MKINWKFWKRRREEPTKKQQAILASWMRYMLKVLPDPNEFYIKGEAPKNKIFFGMPDEVPLAGQAVISPTPRVESFVKGKAVVFVFSEFSREIEVPIVKSMEKVSYGNLDTEVETYLWDFSGLRVIGDEGFKAVCKYLYDQHSWKASYFIEKEGADNGLYANSRTEEDNERDRQKMSKVDWEKNQQMIDDVKKRRGRTDKDSYGDNWAGKNFFQNVETEVPLTGGFNREGELPEEKNEQDNG